MGRVSGPSHDYFLTFTVNSLSGERGPDETYTRSSYPDTGAMDVVENRVPSVC